MIPPAAAALLLLLLIVMALSPAAVLSAPPAEMDEDDDRPQHRVFPAARSESYAAPSGSVSGGAVVLRTVRPAEFEMAHNFNPAAEDILDEAERRYARRFFFMEPDFPRDEPYAEPGVEVMRRPLRRLVINVTSRDDQLRDESYSLRVGDGEDEDGDALLVAKTAWGALRGLETFAQLVEFGWMQPQLGAASAADGPADGRSEEIRRRLRLKGSASSSDGADAGTGVYVIRGAPLAIDDAPAYPYRGLMIDTSRHYLPLDLILANLDAMAMNKLNVLHWHVTDSQSFPFQSELYPELAERGALHPKRVYTHLDINTVLEEAFWRGIRVIPEFDMPGHTQAIARSHPEVMSRCGSNSPPSEPMDPTKNETYDFLENLYEEIAAVFLDEYVHVGGDEVSLDCWKSSDSIQRWMKEHGVPDETALFGYFETRLLDAVAGGRIEKKAIVWQEVFNLGLEIRDDTVVDVWKGYDADTIREATGRGHGVVVSGCWYLDHLGQTWRDYYGCRPRGFNGTDAQKSLVLGGHASMWGEMVDGTNFLPRVWPRASAAAERLWSGDGGGGSGGAEGGGSSSPWEDNVSERLERFRCRMVGAGFPAEPVGVGTACPREWDSPAAAGGATGAAASGRRSADGGTVTASLRNGGVRDGTASER